MTIPGRSAKHPTHPTLTQRQMAVLIAEAIEEDGLTQAEFARRVGATEKHISTVLNGKAFAYPSTLDYWAFVLGRRWNVTLERAS